MRNVLIIAFHFPPHSGSSGLLRALKFCRYLPENGWQPVVLTASPRAYERLDNSQLSEIPAGVPVIRAFARDTQRHFSIHGRYLRWMALPDRWVSWCFGAVPAGLRAIHRQHVEVILSTYPIATTVLIGWLLHRLTGKPWVVDFRDSMTEDEYPTDPLTRRFYRWIERRAVLHASRLLFTARSTIGMYLKRYPALSPDRCVLLPNGYDEQDFLALRPALRPDDTARLPTRLVHMGLLYPSERDPRPFFRALARLKSQGQFDSSTLRIELRASGFEDIYAPMLKQMHLDDLVHLLPPLPYREALQDSADADGLLLFQAANSDHQIPAKGYEYLRLGKPILALTTQTGDTAAVLREAGGSSIVDLADAEAIYRALPQFIDSVRSGRHPLPRPESARRYNRREQVAELARCLSYGFKP